MKTRSNPFWSLIPVELGWVVLVVASATEVKARRVLIPNIEGSRPSWAKDQRHLSTPLISRPTGGPQEYVT